MCHRLLGVLECGKGVDGVHQESLAAFVGNVGWQGDVALYQGLAHPQLLLRPLIPARHTLLLEHGP